MITSALFFLSAVALVTLLIVQRRLSGRRKLWARVGIAAILMAYVLLTGMIAFIGAAFYEREYMSISAVFTLCFFFLIPITILGKFRKRYLVAVWMALFLLLALSIIAVEAYQDYDASFELVTTDIALYDYQPYREGNRLAVLDEPASLHIESSLSMDGATALYPVYAAFAQATYREDLLPTQNYISDPIMSMVACTSTPEAYRRLITGDVDMIFIANPSKEQKQEAEEQGIELEFTPIGKEAFVFFANAANKVDGLSTEQIHQIYSGKITNWRELGGRNRDIEAFQRDNGSGSQSAFLRMMGDTEIISPIPRTITTEMGPMIDYVADYKNYPGAIGYSFRYYTQIMHNNSQIKLLEIDDVYPSVENIRNGSYPQIDYLYAVTDKNNPNPNIRPMLEWILSEQGQELIEKTGYVGIK